MKLNITRVLKDELARLGDPLPAWIDTFLFVINQFIDNVGKCLKGQVTFADNISCKIMKVTLQHNVEYIVNPSSVGKNVTSILGVIPVLMLNSTAAQATDVNRNVVTGFGSNLKSNNNIGIVAQFSEGGTTSAMVTFIILFG